MVLRLFGRELVLPPFLKYTLAALGLIILTVLGYVIVKTENSGELRPVSGSAELKASKSTLLNDGSGDFPDNDIREGDKSESASDAEGESGKSGFAESVIYVYVIGEINCPEVYEIQEGSILKDLVNAAGGLTEKADLEAINLAYKLSGGMMIRIPAKDSSDKTWIIDSGVSNSGSAAAADTIASGVKVNINTASAAELCSLPGVGQSTALKIISYRTENGPFKEISDIMKVNGIKNAKFSEIKAFITVK